MANTFKNQKIRSGTSYEHQLQALQTQIDNISKNITYLDVYNIIDTIEAKDELNVKVAGLVNNSSLVINCPTFQEGDEEYATGDIVLKNNNGEVIHIEAQPGGVYYPKSIDVDRITKNITITYKYATSTPEVNSSYPDKQTTTDTPAETMRFEVELPDSSNKFIYGYWQNTYSFQAIPNVTPQIQVWFVDNNDVPAEQVYCDFVLSENSGSYKVDNLPADAWIKVK